MDAIHGQTDGMVSRVARPFVFVFFFCIKREQEQLKLNTGYSPKLKVRQTK